MTAAPPGWVPDTGAEPEAVIREARRRQHRRWLAVAVAAAVAVGGAAAAVAGAGAGGRPRPPGSHGLPAHRHGLPAAAAHTVALMTVSQTSLPKGGGSLAAGYGAVWVAGTGVTYQINEVTGRIVRTIATPGTLGGCPCASGVAAGAGAVWVTKGCRGIYRIDPHSGRVTASLRIPAGGGIAAAGGLVWVIGGNGRLVRIQPRTGQITGRPIPVRRGVSDHPWLGRTVGDQRRHRRDRQPGHPGYRRGATLWEPRRASGGRRLALDAVRAADRCGHRQRGRVGPRARPGRLAYSGRVTGGLWRGSAWALTVQRSLKVRRIDPATNRFTGKPVTVGKPLPAWGPWPTAIATGPTGLWVLDFSRNLLFHLANRPARA